jgi:hypothetical protein
MDRILDACANVQAEIEIEPRVSNGTSMIERFLFDASIFNTFLSGIIIAGDESECETLRKKAVMDADVVVSTDFLSYVHLQVVCKDIADYKFMCSHFHSNLPFRRFNSVQSGSVTPPCLRNFFTWSM